MCDRAMRSPTPSRNGTRSGKLWKMPALDRARWTRPLKRIRAGEIKGGTARSRGSGDPTPAKALSRLHAALNTSRPIWGYGLYGKPVIPVPPKNGGLERAPECRLPGPKRTLHVYVAYYRA